MDGPWSLIIFNMLWGCINMGSDKVIGKLIYVYLTVSMFVGCILFDVDSLTCYGVEM